MKVSLLNCTPDAMETLIFTKATRLQMSADRMQDIFAMSYEEKMIELEYMANTIPSSWEFVHYNIMIENVTRAFTHQLVRSRNNSYAQQTMRILNVSGFTYETGPSIQTKEQCSLYNDQMDEIQASYDRLIEQGVNIEDARGILPTNIHTNICVSMNLRSVAELISKRSSPRTQGEYREYLNQLREVILEVHPWAELFIKNKKQGAAAKLDQFIQEADPENRIELIKAVDMLRGQ